MSLDLYPNCFKALAYEISDETVERLLRYGGKTSDLLFLEFEFDEFSMRTRPAIMKLGTMIALLNCDTLSKRRLETDLI